MPGLLPFGRENTSSPNSESRRQSAVFPPRDSGPSSRPGTPRGDAASQRIQTTMDSIKRHSLAAITSKHGKEKAEKGQKEKSEKASLPNGPGPAKSNVKLDVIIESPPNMLYGTMQNSTGALLSGLLRVTVVDTDATLDSLSMDLVATITAKKPVVHGCPDCITKVTPLQQWTFIKGTKRLSPNQYNFPFTYLLPGHLPATTQGNLGVLDYHLQATAKLDASTVPLQSAANQQQPITLRRPANIYRAIAPVPEKNSLRIFPPTNITATLTFVPVTHPIGELPIIMRVVGLVENKPKQEMQARWCLRKVQWKLEERERMISPACSKHAHKVGGDGRGMQHEETRIIGHQEFKEGWKTDRDEGKIEVEFKCRPKGTVRPLCDVESPSGLTIAHALVVELVITEEWAPIKKPTHGTPTGAARVLRMQFPIIMTERAGMGIAWDEEQPPMYEDVPESPPLYPVNSQLYPVNSGPDQSSWSQGGLGVPDDAHSEIADYTGPPLDGPSSPSSSSYPASTSAAGHVDQRSGISDNDNMSGWEDMQRPTASASSNYVSSVTAARQPPVNSPLPPPPSPSPSSLLRTRGLDVSDFEVDRPGAQSRRFDHNNDEEEEEAEVEEGEEEQQPRRENDNSNNSNAQ